MQRRLQKCHFPSLGADERRELFTLWAEHAGGKSSALASAHDFLRAGAFIAISRSSLFYFSPGLRLPPAAPTE
jgi:hypothetical protein